MRVVCSERHSLSSPSFIVVVVKNSFCEAHRMIAQKNEVKTMEYPRLWSSQGKITALGQALEQPRLNARIERVDFNRTVVPSANLG